MGTTFNIGQSVESNSIGTNQMNPSEINTINSNPINNQMNTNVINNQPGVVNPIPEINLNNQNEAI